MNLIKCGVPKFEDERTLVHNFKLSGGCKRYFNETELRVTYPCDISHLDDGVLSVPLVANLCTIAWFTGATLQVDKLDAEAKSSLPQIKEGYRNTISQAGLPRDLTGEVVVEETTEPSQSGSEATPAMLFSGGVDSTAGFVRNHSNGDTPALVTVKREETSENSWQTQKENVEEFAAYFDTVPYFLESNLERKMIDDAYIRSESNLEDMGRGWWGGIQYMTGYMGLLAPLAAIKHLSPIYQGSEHPKMSDVPRANSEVVDAIRWTGSRCELSDPELTRQDKIEEVVRHHKSDWPFAIMSAGKGSKKYNRTLLGFLAAGAKVEEFGFDVDESYYSELVEDLNAGIEVSPVSVVWWEEIKRSAELETWSGPKETYDALKTADIYTHTANKTLVRTYGMLPYPVDEIARWTYKIIQ